MIHGATFDPTLDGPRLERLHDRVLHHMTERVRGQWQTYKEIQQFTGGSESGIAARLRAFRSDGYIVLRRRRGEPTSGLHEFKVLLPGELPLT